MTKFVCSYAFDIACYTDFVVEAKTEKAALRQIRQALREGRFADVSADPCWENGPTNERVFIQGPATEFSPTTTLHELTRREHRFSLQTGQCARCGRDAGDDSLDATACPG